MRLNPRIATTALVFALGMAVAPIAAGNASSTSPAVRPNPDEQVLTAQPRPVAPRLVPSPTVQPNPDQQAAVSATQSAGPHSEVIDNGGYGMPNAPATIIRVTTPGGFDWGDAGIGAAGGVALSMIALGLVVLVSQRRSRRSAAIAS